MAHFKTITEAVLRNSTGGELNRVEIPTNYYGETVPKLALADLAKYGLSVGDTITIEERETEADDEVPLEPFAGP